MTARPRRCRGFTLPEVVAALTLTAMLLVVVYQTAHLGLRAQREVAAAVARNDDIRAFTYFLRRQLRHVDTTVRDEGLRFQGDPRFVRFALGGFRGDPSTRLLALRAVPEDEPRQLVASIEPTGPGAARQGVVHAAIGEGLRRVRFEYYGAPGGGDAPAWHDAWQPGEHPPSLLRIRYVGDNGREHMLYLGVGGADGNQVSAYETERGR